jgi:hypothetical protein
VLGEITIHELLSIQAVVLAIIGVVELDTREVAACGIAGQNGTWTS